MDFSLTDEQQLLLDSVDELMERYGLSLIHILHERREDSNA